MLYADLRTSHALGWLDGLRDAGIDVLALSSEIVDDPSTEITRHTDLVGRFRRAIVSRGINTKIRQRVARRAASKGKATTALGAEGVRRVDLLQVAESLLTLARLPRKIRHIRRNVRDFDPDVVHALRIPYEGITALVAVRDRPVVVSSWGQDFTMQAPADPLLRGAMRRLMPHVAAIHVDTTSDIPLARDLGLPADAPTLHAAGNFGIDLALFHPCRDPKSTIVLYPRGQRRYVNHRVFLDLAAELAGDDPTLRFVGVGLEGEVESEALAARIGRDRLQLTAELPRDEFAALARSASFVVSPSTSDGTPNSLLEALACGAYVLAGDVPGVAAILDAPVLASVLDPWDSAAWVSELRRVIATGLHDEALSVNPSAIGTPYRREANVSRVSDFYAAAMRQPTLRR